MDDKATTVFNLQLAAGLFLSVAERGTDEEKEFMRGILYLLKGNEALVKEHFASAIELPSMMRFAGVLTEALKDHAKEQGAKADEEVEDLFNVFSTSSVSGIPEPDNTLKPRDKIDE